MRYLVLRTQNLTKNYGPVQALTNLTFDIEPGEVFGVLGPSGAGKTTLLRAITGLVRPTHGDVYLFGQDMRRAGDAGRRRLGYAPADFHPYPHQTGSVFLRGLASLHPRLDWAHVLSLAGRFGLDLSVPIQRLSDLDMQKLNLVQAVMHQPELLLLDEPDTCLDPAAQAALFQLVYDLRAEGCSIFWLSRSFGSVERIGDRVGMLRAGRLLSVERVIQFKSRLLRRIEIRFAEPVPQETFAGIPNLRDLTLDRRGIVLRCVVKGDPDRLIKTAGQFRVTDLISRESNVEDIFAAYYGEPAYAAA